ncbi:AAA family ATPase [Streptomyces anulatus]|uniref:AAA family ATPase n=1 Tax=Streptomyces anulatus TaxID=1892 RepID=UPI00364D7295
MAAIMQVLGWKADGLRCPDHEIDFRKSGDDPHRVSLIQMPNGTGKTTTLTLLRAALSGVAADGSWDGRQMMKLRKNADQGYGIFEVRLMLGAERVTIIMTFDFEVSRVRYKTTRGEGQHEGFDPPFDFRRFLTESFVESFVFDGELAERLLKEEHLHAEEIVENLFQVSALKTLETKVAEHWVKLTRDASATEEVGLTRRQNRLEKLRRHLTTLETAKAELENGRNETLSRLKQQQDTYTQEINKENTRAAALEAFKNEASGLQARVREDSLEILDMMRSPNALSPVFARKLQDLKTGLDRVKLPESAAREFFHELADERECVCGRPIDEHVRGVIRSRAEKYLGSDDVTLLNTMKTAIHNSVGDSYSAAEEALRGKFQDLGEVIDDERTARNEIDHLQMAAEHADPAVREASDEIKRLEARLLEIERKLDRFSSKERGDNSPDIEVINKLIREAEQDVAEITHTIELKNKRDVLTAIIRKAYASARHGILSEVRDAANQRIKELMPYNDIRIKRIERCLVLEGKEGGSVGENLSVAYAFLASLFNRSDHQLPFIVDSPANPIDLANRARVGPLVPQLTQQFIAFTISSEREQFVPKLKQACDGEVQFITLFRKVDEKLNQKARFIPTHTESEDGIIVHGEPFFNEFQVESEAAA